MATEEPISSFPMDNEAAEEEIALLVRKPGFDELTTADIVRHMNNRFNINFDLYKKQLKKMVWDEIKKRNEENGSDSSDEDESGSDNDSDNDGDIGSEKPKQPKKEIKQEGEEPKSTKRNDSDSDSGVKESVVKKTTKTSTSRIQTDMASNIKSSRRAAASEAIKQIKYSSGGGRFGSSRRAKEKDPNADMSGKFGPMTKLCYISTELQQVTKDQWMKRCDVMKVMWDYIKDNNLKDPKNGQFIICDSVLEAVFKKRRFKGFGMAKFLTKHIIGTNDLPPDMREEAEQEMDKRRQAWKERQRQRQLDVDREELSNDSEGPSAKKPKKEEEDDDSDKQNGEQSSSDNE